MPQRTFPSHHLKVVTNADEPHPLPLIVAMIVPAGDATAFERIFSRLPLSLGITYLIIEYYGASGGRASGGRAENLPALLERTTLLPLRMPTQDTVLEKDCVYLLPPGTAIGLVRGRLIFQGPVANGAHYYLHDLFLSSVAAGSCGRCIVFLLAEMAANVLPGLRVVRDEGGFTMVLDEEDPFMPPYPEYPCSLIDLSLRPAEIAPRLTGLANYFRGGGIKDGAHPGVPPDWSPIYRLLLDRTGFDYSRYPQEEIVRRIHRRMAIREISLSDKYIDIAAAEEEEFTRLNEELQSTVSGFFIEPDLVASLVGSVLPRWVGSGPRPAPLRVWLPHCPGGHQAHSIAIVIANWLEEKGLDSSFQLFITGFDNNNIARARKGLYSKKEMAFVPRNKKRRFFARKESHWQVIKSIRDKCVFATHDLLKDSPFSHIDIVIESGSLIGFETDSRAKAYRLFHYALAPDGAFIANTRFPHAVPGEFYLPVERYDGLYSRRTAPSNFWLGGPKPAPALHIGEQEADRLLLSGYVPASFLVDEQFKVIRFYGNTEPYLRAGRDPSSRYLLRIVRDELVFELNDLIELTDKAGRAVIRKGILLGDGNQSTEISVEMVPLRSFGANRRLIIIREKGTLPEDSVSGEDTGRGTSPRESRIQNTEREVQEMRGLLLAAEQDAGKVQTTLQQANEDLQSANEEYLSLNKELRSLNDELNGRHEEMLRRHKELIVLNEGLRAHIREMQVAAESAMAIVSTLRRPIVVLREDLRIHTANQAFLRLFNLSAEQALGKYFHSIGPEVFRRDGMRHRLHQVQTERLGADLEIRHQFPEGGEMTLHFSISRIAGVPGLRAGLLIAIDDVTEQRDFQRFKDELIGIASHELRTPATSIRAYSELLMQELPRDRDSKFSDLIGKLNNQVDRLSLLSKDLLDVSRITRGKIILEEEFFDINTLIRETAAATQPSAAVPISVDVLPPAPPFHGDRERIARVLDNLLSNAANYSARSGAVGVRSNVTKENVEVSIHVSGAGMPLEDLRQIFDQEYPPDRTSSIRIPPVNLGLYISAIIVRKHGGTITVTSEKDKGSAISVILPFEKKRAASLSAV